MHLQPIYTKRGTRLHIALEHPTRHTIVAMGSFPVNCPREAIAGWIRKQEEKFIGFFSGTERAYTPAV